MLFWRKSKYLYVKNIHKIKKCVRKKSHILQITFQLILFPIFSHYPFVNRWHESSIKHILLVLIIYFHHIFLFQKYQTSSSIYKHTMRKNLNYRRFIYLQNISTNSSVTLSSVVFKCGALWMWESSWLTEGRWFYPGARSCLK
jgi:hypothetical protein